VFHNRWHFSQARISGQPAVVAYSWNDSAAAYQLAVLNVRSFRGDRIAAISAFLDSVLLALRTAGNLAE
jgi:RNA polymerase sigma-70 factor (ECF subfamily)